MLPPETRDTLLARVRDPGDQRAWDEFVGIYRPLICDLARRRGLQEADVQDLAQQVLLAVSQAIADWEPREGARFHHWLTRVARNAIVNALTRRRRDAATGGTTAVAWLRSQADPADPLWSEIEVEHRRQLLRRAARDVREAVEPESWRAFWLMSVEGRSVEEAAELLGKRVGAVYAARMRVMRRLQQRVRELDL